VDAINRLAVCFVTTNDQYDMDSTKHEHGLVLLDLSLRLGGE